MPETTFNRVGLTYQPPTGILTMDDENGRLLMKDAKDVVTVLVDRTAQSTPERVKPIIRATWSEMGREASLQLYLEGYDEATTQQPQNADDSNEGGNGDSRDGHKKIKVVPFFYRIHGLNVKDEQKFRDFLTKCCSPYNVILDTEPWDVRGANYGLLEISNLKRCIVLNNFDDKSRPAIEIPLANVSQIAAPGKNEVEIQYTFPAPDPSARITDKFELSVCRLYVHPTDDDEEENEPVSGMQVEDGGEDGPAEFAEKVRRKIKLVADLNDESDEASLGLACQIDERWCNFNAPRGKYRMDCYKDFFRMRGKTYDFKIPYATITQMNLLDHPETFSKFLVISLSVPLRSGQQRYPHLVMTIEDTTSDLEMVISDEEIAERYGPETGLSQKMTGNMPEQIAKLLKVLSQKKVFVMPSNGFFAMKEDGDVSDSQAARDRCIKCAFKATQGFLFPMKSSLVFLHKPVLYIRYEKIDSLTFRRSSADSKSFDLTFNLKDAQDTGSTSTTVEFGQIPRKQFENLKKFFTTQTKVTIKNKQSELDTFFTKDVGKKGSRGQTILDLGNDDDDDEEEDDSDFETKPKKKKSKEKSPGGAGAGGEDDDDDDDDDSDDGSSGGSGSSSDDESDNSSMAEELPFDPNELEGIAGEEVEGKRKRQKTSSSDAIKKKKKKQSGVEASPTKAGGKKKKKDPNAPKPAKSAYSYFMEAKRPELRDQGITDFIEQSKKTSELWKQQQDKSEYERLAEQDRARHEKEMESYVPPEAVDDEPVSKSPAKKKKDPNAPKAAKNAFNYFTDQHRAQAKIGEDGATLGLGETQKKLAALWNALSEQDRVPYNEMAKKDKERYLTEMKTYVPPAGMENPAAAKKKKPAASSKPKAASSSSASAGAAGGGAIKKKAKPLAGGELPSSDDDSSSDDSSSDDSSSEDE